jgi:hypothetical protein
MPGDASLELPLYFIGFLMTLEAARAVRSPRTRVVWRGLRWRHARPALVAIPLVLLIGAMIAALVPWTQWGWWTALGGEGNVAFGRAAGAESATPSMVLRVAPFFLLAAMLCYLPAAARLEERWFRRGSERRTVRQQLAVAVGFGLAHLVMGIPIAFALALTATGWILRTEYLQAYQRRGSRHDALMASTHVHLAYNLILVSFAALSLGLTLVR